MQQFTLVLHGFWLSCVIFSLPLHAVDTPKQEWVVQFGTVQMDKPLGLATDDDGHCYVVGKTDDCLAQKAFGKTDGFMVKYTPEGTLAWSRQIGTPEDDMVHNIALDASQKIYILGRTEGKLGDKHIGMTDGFVSKYTNQGILIWPHQFGSPEADNPSRIIVDAQGNSYAIGSAVCPVLGMSEG